MKLFYVKQKSTGLILNFKDWDCSRDFNLGEYGSPYLVQCKEDVENWLNENSHSDTLDNFSLSFIEAIDNKDLIVCEVEL